ncbi:hypothetical protein DFH06DRAFT_970558, partial [Mycena polygramma]
VEVSPPRNHPNCVSIKEVLATTKCPRKFNVRARVVDFFPFKLNDAFVRTCTKCNALIPEKRLSCFGCDDVGNQYLKVVCVLRLAVMDAADQILQLSVSGHVPLLDGMEPAILRDNPEVARQFSKRMEPLLGNLEAVHEGILKEEVLEPSGLEMTLVIDSWEGPDKSIVYGLRSYEP